MSSFQKDFHYFVTSVVSGLTAFTTWQTLKNQYYIHQNKKKLNSIKNNQVLGVEDIVGHGKKINDVVVKGLIGTKDGKQVNINKGYFGSNQKYAVHLTFTEAMYSNDAYQKDNYQLNMKNILKKSTIQGSSRVTLYSQTKEGKKSILLKNFDQKDYSKVMQIIKWEEKRRSLDIIEHITAFFLSIIEALVTIGSERRQAPHIKGIQVGKRDVEVGVKIGVTATILGTIGITTEGEYFIEPNQIFKDRLSQIAGLEQKLEQLFKKRNIWLGLSLLGSIYIGRRAFKYVKENNIKIPYINP